MCVGKVCICTFLCVRGREREIVCEKERVREKTRKRARDRVREGIGEREGEGDGRK